MEKGLADKEDAPLAEVLLEEEGGQTALQDLEFI